MNVIKSPFHTMSDLFSDFGIESSHVKDKISFR